MENLGKTAVFPGGYGRIGEILHGRIWPDWGLKGWTVSISTQKGCSVRKLTINVIFILCALKISLDHVPFGGSTFGTINPKLLFPWQPNIWYVWLKFERKTFH